MKIMRFKYVLLFFISLCIFTNCSIENDVNKIVITSDDYMKFNTSKITVKSGKLVKLTLKHIGRLDVQVMGHNFVLLKDKVDIVEFANKAAMASKNQYIPVESNEVIVYTDMIGGGQETTIEFLPPEVGVYNFICSFPGHYAMMKGKFIVE
ncbi:MAG: azurin [Flavobacteriaceae bacterium]|uniref:Blue (type 1) copper domain-containing protein n=1 Tax=marine metagenome TaxID=408172 RepID=A0A381RHC9_9ZZZZ|nr:azurin [Flavobacteriaceae bacterium]MEE2616376.1 azurin [Bacteroidota bacterium]|tara:strand:+ start:384 stop:836 length:453 start_codon:yes stop_codon:yes gene_type:complete